MQYNYYRVMIFICVFFFYLFKILVRGKCSECIGFSAVSRLGGFYVNDGSAQMLRRRGPSNKYT